MLLRNFQILLIRQQKSGFSNWNYWLTWLRAPVLNQLSNIVEEGKETVEEEEAKEVEDIKVLKLMMKWIGFEYHYLLIQDLAIKLEINMELSHKFITLTYVCWLFTRNSTDVGLLSSYFNLYIMDLNLVRYLVFILKKFYLQKKVFIPSLQTM